MGVTFWGGKVSPNHNNTNLIPFTPTPPPGGETKNANKKGYKYYMQ